MSASQNNLILSQTLSGTHYAKSVDKAPHRGAWMDIAVFAGETLSTPQAPLHSTARNLCASCTTTSSGAGASTSTSSSSGVVGKNRGVGLVQGVVPSRAGDAVYRGHDLVEAGLVTGSPVATFRLEFELWPSESPNTVANFLNLCTESNALRAPIIYQQEPLPLSYRGTFFHKIVPGLAVQGGDLTKLLAGGANHVSSFGKPFEDENLKHRLNVPGLLAMANNGPNSNGSQFFITTGNDAEEKSINGRHCCFGRVVSGLKELLEHVAPFGNDRGEALRFAIVTACGSSSS